ncbi:MAG: hypothetical protein J3Q66DRAFT_92157 [Benniella sp.]|nr:MAG: hypothetical protein J3Q66DRAFT_92157 [Benniella sp.]
MVVITKGDAGRPWLVDIARVKICDQYLLRRECQKKRRAAAHLGGSDLPWFSRIAHELILPLPVEISGTWSPIASVLSQHIPWSRFLSMSKRPLTSASDPAQPPQKTRRTGGNGTGDGISSSSSNTPAQDCTTDVTDPAADLKNKLLLAIFSKRPAKHEIHAVEYIVSLTSLPLSTPSNGDYVAFVKGIHPSVSTDCMDRAWKKIKLYFDTMVPDPEIDGRMDVDAFRTALHESPAVNLDTSSTIPEPESTASSSRSRPPSGRSRNSSSGGGSCSNLTQAQITALQITFHDNFTRFNGAPWLLPSKTAFDERLRGSIEHLSMESALHSFIIEDTDPIIRLFENAADQEEVKRVMSRGGGLPALSSAETAFLKQYNKAPTDLEEYLSTHGWRNVGEDL